MWNVQRPPMLKPGVVLTFPSAQAAFKHQLISSFAPNITTTAAQELCDFNVNMLLWSTCYLILLFFLGRQSPVNKYKKNAYLTSEFVVEIFSTKDRSQPTLVIFLCCFLLALHPTTLVLFLCTYEIWHRHWEQCELFPVFSRKLFWITKVLHFAGGNIKHQIHTNTHIQVDAKQKKILQLWRFFPASSIRDRSAAVITLL